MDKLTKIKVTGIPEGFQELNVSINDVTLNYVVGPNNGLPLLLIPGQMELDFRQNLTTERNCVKLRA